MLAKFNEKKHVKMLDFGAVELALNTDHQQQLEASDEKIDIKIELPERASTAESI